MIGTSLFERLPVPTCELVAAKSEQFELENRLCEEALKQLREKFPQNNEIAPVLLKVVVLNKLYSTRVNDIDIFPLAEHIAGLGIDALISQGDPAAVKQIFKCENLRMY